MRNTGLGIAVITGILALSACGGGPESDMAPAERVTHPLDIRRFEFEVPNGSVKTGDVILWTNQDLVPHAVAEGNSDHGIRIAPGDSARMVIGKLPARWHCPFHLGMSVEIGS